MLAAYFRANNTNTLCGRIYNTLTLQPRAYMFTTGNYKVNEEQNRYEWFIIQL